MAGFRWIKNEANPTQVGPKVVPGKFAAGASQAIAKGQLLELTGNTNTEFVPIDSDHDATATKLAIANQDVTSGDLAGYYEVIEIMPGDVFECDLATAAATEPATAMYYSSPTAVAASGSNIIGYTTVMDSNHPGLQKRLSQGGLGDLGTTFRTASKVWLIFRAAVSTYSLKQRA